MNTGNRRHKNEELSLHVGAMRSVTSQLVLSSVFQFCFLLTDRVQGPVEPSSSIHVLPVRKKIMYLNKMNSHSLTKHIQEPS